MIGRRQGGTDPGWQPTPGSLPGKSHRVGWWATQPVRVAQESDTTEHARTHGRSQGETRHEENRSVDTWFPTDAWSLGYSKHVHLRAREPRALGVGGWGSPEWPPLSTGRPPLLLSHPPPSPPRPPNQREQIVIRLAPAKKSTALLTPAVR